MEFRFSPSLNREPFRKENVLLCALIWFQVIKDDDLMKTSKPNEVPIPGEFHPDGSEEEWKKRRGK